MMMTTMVKECDGWMTPCNGSTTVECIHVVEFDEEIEFQMDTEVHRWILEETNSNPKKPFIKKSEQPNNPACTGKGCEGRYNVGNNGRQCAPFQQCRD